MTSDAAAARAEASPTDRELAVARRLIRPTHFIGKASTEFVAAVAALLRVSFDDPASARSAMASALHSRGFARRSLF
jgi:hypothetical protein